MSPVPDIAQLRLMFEDVETPAPANDDDTAAMPRTTPSRYGSHTTCVNRFNRWRKAGHWARMLHSVSAAYEGDIQMIDSSSIRVH